MEKVLKLTHVTPKIELVKNEYDRLVSLAQANADEIEKRAVEYYKKNGVCNIHIDAYVRSKTAYSDDMADTFRFDCQPQYGYVTPSDECEPNPFAIDKETRLRIMRYASDYVTSVFTHKFGNQLKHINKAKEYEYRARRDWRISRAVTLIGWVVAVLLLVVAIIK